MDQPEYPVMEGPVCPLPLRHDEKIVLGHGSGGRMTRDLIEKIFKPYLTNPPLEAGNDFARLPVVPPSSELVVSTDCHVVAPLFFPGGDIGRLAVCGTVNDIAMSGAQPLYLTAGFILEEGLAVNELLQVLGSMKSAAVEAGIQVVAGDTKVVEKGKADRLFITTSGVGVVDKTLQISGAAARAGDAVLISGSIGDHGIAVLAQRGELGFSAQVKSDVAPLNHLIRAVLQSAPNTHVLRDPTRGGLATTLNEIAAQSQVNIVLDEQALPVNPAVQAACEMLGFDPLYVANEGKVIVIVPEEEADKALAAMRSCRYGENAARIGSVQASPPGRVLLRTSIGATRILDMLAGEMLPRIC